MDYWIYRSIPGKSITIVYKIDGKTYSKHEAAHYLMTQRNMSQEEAYDYINNLKHL